MKAIRIIFLLVLLPMVKLYGQNRVKLISDPKLDSLVAKNIELSKSQQTIDGYRIQLFSGSERNNANALRGKFKTEYPDQNVYLIYQQPYFKLRVGDYRNLIEAQEMYLKLQKSYGQLLIVPDKINLPKL
jgi:hypothetical protein